jgi:alkylhydroperoxidase family enzyme
MEPRLDGAWRETFFTPRERAALEWCKALTLVAQTHAPSGLYESVRQHFAAHARV